ncbi:FAD-binding protein [Methylobacterium marchantiae]|uniref:FAD-binding protein n=1 Tax=Methylobacterium marchantiae TaxID=600331 RepID=A0ABW3X403_9HYPH
MDPVLVAHAAGDNCFEISGEFAPASIRDQMVRARLVVDRLIENGLLDNESLSLLVIGAGSTGLTAAIRAASLGVRTVVVSKDKPGFRLRRCLSRDVEPTLYDWPASHWPEARFPWAGETMPLTWEAMVASRIAIDWSNQLRAWRSKLGSLLDIRYSTTVKLAFSPSGSMRDDVEATFNSPTVTYATERFGAVVSCIGWGSESCEAISTPHAQSYRGFDFWDTDQFQGLNCGLSSQPNILISGGGDGALQDLIRILTRKSAAQAFALILDALRGHAGVLAAMTEEIREAEDIARRALSWNLHEKHDAMAFKRLEAAHIRAIAHLQGSAAWPSVDRAIKAMLIPSMPLIHLVHSKPYFAQCYPLNRFIGLLLIAVAAGEIRKPNTRVVRVVGKGHICEGKPRTCHGKAHDVSIRDAAGAITTTTYDVVILRHGLVGPKRFLPGKAVRVRQILPYCVQQ